LLDAMPEPADTDTHRFSHWTMTSYVTDVNVTTVIFTAVWEISAIRWEVRLVNHEDGAELDEIVNDGALFELPNVRSVRAGYAFAGWIVDGELQLPGNVIAVRNDLIITGSWVGLYTITFMHGFEHNNQTSFRLGERVVLTEATRHGFTFNGWWTEETGGSRVEEIAGSGNITVWARWSTTTTQFTITLRNVTVAERNNQVTFTTADLTPALRLNDALAREGYRFDGWWTAPTGGTRIIEITVGADITLYARWTAVDAEGRPIYPVEESVNPWPWLAIGFCVGVVIWIALWFTILKKKFA